MAWNLSTGMKKALLGVTAPYGSLAEILANGTIDVYSTSRPSTGADAAEAGVLLLSLTLNGDAFVAGVATNGLNMGEFVSTTLKRAIDAVTTNTEIWKGAGLADGTAAWCRFYANAKTTGASTSAVRMDGVVAVSGGEVNLANGTSIVTGIDSEVSDVSFTIAGT